MANTHTLVLIKPDAVARGLVGAITSRFERRGLKLVGCKMILADRNVLDQHYNDLVDKPYYPEIVKTMTLGPLVAQVWNGINVVSAVRAMLGATDPVLAAPGTIRGDFAMHIGRNICHASATQEEAQREIKLWFDNKLYNDCNELAMKELIYRV